MTQFVIGSSDTVCPSGAAPAGPQRSDLGNLVERSCEGSDRGVNVGQLV